MERPNATRRPYARALIGFVCLLLALPATAWAGGGGGSGLGSGSGSGSGSGNSGTSTSPTAPAPTVTPRRADNTVSTTGDGITVHARASSMLWRGATFTGSAPGDAGKTVEIERAGHQTDGAWAATTHATVGSDGSFTARWPANHIGRFSIRAVLISGAARSADAIPQSASSTAAMTITVYRPAIATLYGPGFYGHRTACGQKLTKTMIGVANRTLKCGTKVALYWGGKMLVVPVIDRGPYANSADWDLTMATGRAMGMNGTEHVGAVSLPAR